MKIITAQVNAAICRDTKKLGIEYVPTPSRFIASKTSPFYPGNEEIVAAECRYPTEKQLPDAHIKSHGSGGRNTKNGGSLKTGGRAISS